MIIQVGTPTREGVDCLRSVPTPNDHPVGTPTREGVACLRSVPTPNDPFAMHVRHIQDSERSLWRGLIFRDALNIHVLCGSSLNFDAPIYRSDAMHLMLVAIRAGSVDA